MVGSLLESQVRSENGATCREAMFIEMKRINRGYPLFLYCALCLDEWPHVYYSNTTKDVLL